MRIAALLLLYSMLSSTNYSGRVISVTDGDTIKVKTANHVVHIVRLNGIDAPEHNQAWGQRSKQHLSDLVFGKDVQVMTRKKDRYGRDLGKVLVNGKDVNLAQVKAGMAWWYRYYAKDQSKPDHGAYQSAELEAKRLKRGLWADKHAIPPWEFRQKKRGN